MGVFSSGESLLVVGGVYSWNKIMSLLGWQEEEFCHPSMIVFICIEFVFPMA
jgi:hypothetical protein